MELIQDPVARDFLGGVFWMIALFWIVGVAATVFWLWMLIDALVSLRDPVEKILWFLVIFFLHFVGALIYLIVRRPGPARLAHH